ncbi:MAG TPA: methylated-DNA--[protein]-cysteine S-methyltransferase [Stellaceae bacterium]|nr:methylated-DNA--[protein]-cysteine S-methyltransferase [Stellaceae bacterium]
MNIHSANACSAKKSAVAHQQEIVAEEIRFATARSELGTILVARSPAGVCAILVGDEAKALKRDLAEEFEDARLVRDDRRLNTDLDKVLTFIENPAKGLDLPLDIRGTPFQRRVWTALLGVRVGYKITYAALASRIGEPHAVRAVANACAANAIALAIPCHRVVRSDGALAGYRWGMERKQSMIEKEAGVRA